MPGGGAPARGIVAAGNVNVDVLIGPVAPWPTPGTEVVADRSSLRVGGALGNLALALAGLGVRARLVWDVGDDALGAWLGDALGAVGSPPRRVPAPTSVTVGLTHPDGERTFVSHLGHLSASEPDALRTAAAAAAPGDLLFVGGTFLLPRWRPALPGILADARGRGVRTVLDTGWPTGGWTGDAVAELEGLLPHVDVFLPNLEEALGYLRRRDGAGGDRVAGAAPAGTRPLDDRQLREALARLGAVTAGTVVVKLGAEGAAWHEDGRLRRVTAPRTRVLDTVGAGDTFAAAVLAATVRGWGWDHVVAAAVGVASAAIATDPRRYPTLEEALGAVASAGTAGEGG